MHWTAEARPVCMADFLGPPQVMCIVGRQRAYEQESSAFHSPGENPVVSPTRRVAVLPRNCLWTSSGLVARRTRGWTGSAHAVGFGSALARDHRPRCGDGQEAQAETMTPNQITSLDAGMLLQLHAGRHWPGASEFHRWAR